jgi:hypothetical protein
LVNGWGLTSREATWDLGDPSEFPGHADIDGTGDSERPELEFDVGGDARLLPLLATGAGPTSAVLAPMLFELGGVAAYDGLLVYATVTPRKGTPSLPIVPFSREHWVGYSFGDSTVRAGRLVLPFGIRTPDHTQYVREDFGFDKWDQDYALEVDWQPANVSVSLAAFLGDLLDDPARLRAAGGVLRVAYTFDTLLEVGISALASRAPARDRVAGSAFARVRPYDETYLIGEYALQRFRLRELDENRSTYAGFARAGWFALPELDLFVEGGIRDVSGQLNLAKSRLGLGASWHAMQWFELIPQVLAEKLPDVGTQYVAMAQLHLMY